MQSIMGFVQIKISRMAWFENEEQIDWPYSAYMQTKDLHFPDWLTPCEKWRQFGMYTLNQLWYDLLTPQQVETLKDWGILLRIPRSNTQTRRWLQAFLL